MRTTKPGENIPNGLSRRIYPEMVGEPSKVYLKFAIPLFWHGRYYDIRHDDFRVGWQYLMCLMAWWKPVTGVTSLAGQIVFDMQPCGEGRLSPSVVR